MKIEQNYYVMNRAMAVFTSPQDEYVPAANYGFRLENEEGEEIFLNAFNPSSEEEIKHGMAVRNKRLKKEAKQLKP